MTDHSEFLTRYRRMREVRLHLNNVLVGTIPKLTGSANLTYYVDGIPVQTVENTHWHQPLYLSFDSETMPDWFGMPDDADLPSTFSVDYVRARKRR